MLRHEKLTVSEAAVWFLEVKHEGRTVGREEEVYLGPWALGRGKIIWVVSKDMGPACVAGLL